MSCFAAKPEDPGPKANNARPPDNNDELFLFTPNPALAPLAPVLQATGARKVSSLSLNHLNPRTPNQNILQPRQARGPLSPNSTKPDLLRMSANPQDPASRAQASLQRRKAAKKPDVRSKSGVPQQKTTNGLAQMRSPQPPLTAPLLNRPDLRPQGLLSQRQAMTSFTKLQSSVSGQSAPLVTLANRPAVSRPNSSERSPKIPTSNPDRLTVAHPTPWQQRQSARTLQHPACLLPGRPQRPQQTTLNRAGLSTISTARTSSSVVIQQVEDTSQSRGPSTSASGPPRLLQNGTNPVQGKPPTQPQPQIPTAPDSAKMKQRSTGKAQKQAIGQSSPRTQTQQHPASLQSGRPQAPQQNISTKSQVSQTSTAQDSHSITINQALPPTRDIIRPASSPRGCAQSGSRGVGGKNTPSSAKPAMTPASLRPDPAILKQLSVLTSQMQNVRESAARQQADARRKHSEQSKQRAEQIKSLKAQVASNKAAKRPDNPVNASKVLLEQLQAQRSAERKRWLQEKAAMKEQQAETLNKVRDEHQKILRQHVEEARNAGMMVRVPTKPKLKTNSKKGGVKSQAHVGGGAKVKVKLGQDKAQVDDRKGKGKGKSKAKSKKKTPIPVTLGPDQDADSNRSIHEAKGLSKWREGRKTKREKKKENGERKDDKAGTHEENSHGPPSEVEHGKKGRKESFEGKAKKNKDKVDKKYVKNDLVDNKNNDKKRSEESNVFCTEQSTQHFSWSLGLYMPEKPAETSRSDQSSSEQSSSDSFSDTDEDLSDSEGDSSDSEDNPSELDDDLSDSEDDDEYEELQLEFEALQEACEYESYETTLYEPTQYYPTQNEPTTYEPTTYEPPTYEPTKYEPTQYEPSPYQPSPYEPSPCDPTQYEPTHYNPTPSHSLSPPQDRKVQWQPSLQHQRTEEYEAHNFTSQQTQYYSEVKEYPGQNSNDHYGYEAQSASQSEHHTAAYVASSAAIGADDELAAAAYYHGHDGDQEDESAYLANEEQYQNQAEWQTYQDHTVFESAESYSDGHEESDGDCYEDGTAQWYGEEYTEGYEENEYGTDIENEEVMQQSMDYEDDESGYEANGQGNEIDYEVYDQSLGLVYDVDELAEELDSELDEQEEGSSEEDEDDDGDSSGGDEDEDEDDDEDEDEDADDDNDDDEDEISDSSDDEDDEETEADFEASEPDDEFNYQLEEEDVGYEY